MYLRAVACIFLFYITSSWADQLAVVPGQDFDNFIKESKYVLGLFFQGAESCPSCAQYEAELEKVTTPEIYEHEIKKIKCEDLKVAMKFGVNTVPQVVFFRDGVPAVYDSPDNNVEVLSEDIQAWLNQAKDVATQELTDETFEHLTQAATGATTGDWLVIFYCPKCEECLPAIEGAGVKIKHQMNVAKVNVEENPGLKARFKIKDCPSTYYFRHGKMYHYYSEDTDNYQVKSLLSFVLYWYKNVDAKPVPGEKTGFDKLTDYIVDRIREQMTGPNRSIILIAFAMIIGIISLYIIFALVFKKPKRTKKD